MTLPSISLLPYLPEIVLLITALLVLIIDTFVGEKRWLVWLALLGTAVAGFATWSLSQGATLYLQDMLVADPYALFIDMVVLIIAAISLLLAYDWLNDRAHQQGEYVALLLFSAVGMMTMGAAVNVITIFVALEILSLALYVLTGFARERLTSGEAALKYFLLGAFASAFFLYGAALLYGATGHFDLVGIGKNMAGSGLMAAAGVALLLVGFSFKVALAPFHMWTPDVYQGAPTSVTAFMSVGAKAAGFAAFLRFFHVALAGSYPLWGPALAALAVLTMTWGNLAALSQESVKRLLAYSSIAHAGYALVGLAAGNAMGMSGLLFYLLAYAFMNLGAFGVVIMLEKKGSGDLTMSSLRGAARQHPLLAATMAVFMFSLAGVPPLAGFFGKFYVFGAAVKANMTWLAIVGIINSAISAYYYLRVSVLMYMVEPDENTTDVGTKNRPVLAFALLVALVFVIGIGLWPGVWMQMAQQAAALLG